MSEMRMGPRLGQLQVASAATVCQGRIWCFNAEQCMSMYGIMLQDMFSAWSVCIALSMHASCKELPSHDTAVPGASA